MVTETKHVEVFEFVYPGTRRESDAHAVELTKFNRDMRTKVPVLGEISNMDFVILWQIKLKKMKIFLNQITFTAEASVHINGHMNGQQLSCK